MSLYDYDDMSSSESIMEQGPVLFPPPPPTTNMLSATERARLVRSSNKLRRILGTTPHFVDFDFMFEPGGMDDPQAKLNLKVPLKFDNAPSLRSSDSFSDMTSSSSCSTCNSRTSAAVTAFASPAASLSRSPSLTRVPKQDMYNTWHGRMRKPRPPMLCLATAATPRPMTPSGGHRRSSPLDGSLDASAPFLATPVANTFFRAAQSPTPTASSFPLTSTPSPSPEDHSESPLPSPISSKFSFRIPSPTSARRKKMDKLRKTLGDDVPVVLVYPPEEESDVEEELCWRSNGRTSSSSGSGSSEEEELNTPDTSPVSSTVALINIVDGSSQPDTTSSEIDIPITGSKKAISPVLRKHALPRKIVNTRDSLVLGTGLASRNLSKARGSPSNQSRVLTIDIPQANRPAPPPPPGSPVKPKKVSRKPVPPLDMELDVPSVQFNISPSLPRLNNPTAMLFEHRKALSSGSVGRSTGVALGVIMESPLEESFENGIAKETSSIGSEESKWFEGDCEEEDSDNDAESFQFLEEADALEAAGYGAWSGKGRGMGRGLARSYAYASSSMG